MRLQKFLSRAGVASRRGSENLMTAGRVTVNGQIVRELGTKVDPTSDAIAVDGTPVHLSDGATYLMLHKPTGVLTTMHDPHGRPTVAGLVKNAEQPALFPVGRLDADTSGLLLFMTDGDLGHRLTHPKYEFFKTYEVRVKGTPSQQAIEALQQGIMLEDGMTAPAQVSYDVHAKTLILRIHEGRKRQVRRMCDEIGYPVTALHRSGFGPLLLGDLPKGSWRHLTEEEVTMVKKAVAGTRGKVGA